MSVRQHFVVHAIAMSNASNGYGHRDFLIELLVFCVFIACRRAFACCIGPPFPPFPPLAPAPAPPEPMFKCGPPPTEEDCASSTSIIATCSSNISSTMGESCLEAAGTPLPPDADG